MALLCHCWVVSDRTVAQAVADGAQSLDEVQDRCHAGTACGACIASIEATLQRCRVAAETSISAVA
jgi:NAD(P)H-nitrite reductase large subunit